MNRADIIRQFQSCSCIDSNSAGASKGVVSTSTTSASKVAHAPFRHQDAKAPTSPRRQATPTSPAGKHAHPAASIGTTSTATTSPRIRHPVHDDVGAQGAVGGGGVTRGVAVGGANLSAVNGDVNVGGGHGVALNFQTSANQYPEYAQV